MTQIMAKLLLALLFLSQAACDQVGGTASSDDFEINTGLDAFTKKIQGANTFRCSTCHTFEGVSSPFRTAGHDLTNAAFRTTYKNGALTDLRDAVNNCIEHWMNGTPWEESDNRWMLLNEFLRTGDSENTSNLSYNIISPPSVLTGGDRIDGMVTFDQTCAACHGLGGVGTERAPSIAGTSLSPETIARRVRTSGPDDTGVYPGLTGGRMPFWSQSRLTDDELRDIIAFLDATVPIEPGGGNGQTPADISLPGAQTSGACGNDHPAVGSTAIFSTFSHDVAGTVEVIDNCTLQISNFTFDGGGIDIRIYTGVNGNFSSGEIISEDLLGTSFSNNTVTVRLPSSISLNDFDSVSVWCVPVGVSFGDASWASP